MKTLLLLLAFFPLLIQAQSVKAKLGTGGSFIILNHGTPGVDEFVKLLIKETGEVDWYLDGQDLFIRDGFFNDPADILMHKKFCGVLLVSSINLYNINSR